VAVAIGAGVSVGEGERVTVDVVVGKTATGVAVGEGPHPTRNNRLRNTSALHLETPIPVNSRLLTARTLTNLPRARVGIFRVRILA
jgi:hypothetical protein